MNVRNQRSAMEKSLEYLDWFASDFFEHLNIYFGKVSEIEKAMVKAAVGDNKARLTDIFKEPIDIEINSEDKFIMNRAQLKAYSIQLSCMRTARADIILNQLEYFSAAMANGNHASEKDILFEAIREHGIELSRQDIELILIQFTEQQDLEKNLDNRHPLTRAFINLTKNKEIFKQLTVQSH